jgi:hypothetical protein
MAAQIRLSLFPVNKLSSHYCSPPTKASKVKPSDNSCRLSQNQEKRSWNFLRDLVPDGPIPEQRVGDSLPVYVLRIE